MFRIFTPYHIYGLQIFFSHSIGYLFIVLIVSVYLEEAFYFDIIPGGPSDKEPACQFRSCGDVGLIPELGRSPGGGHDSPLQYSCLKNLMDREAWWAKIHRVTKSQTRLKWLSMFMHSPTYSCFRCLCLWCHIQKIIAKTSVKELSHIFFLIILWFKVLQLSLQSILS